MSTLTDDIRAATAAARDQLDIADAKADAIDALPPSSPSSSGPLAWPIGQNCIDQSAFPYTFTIPAGDMDSGGFLSRITADPLRERARAWCTSLVIPSCRLVRPR